MAKSIETIKTDNIITYKEENGIVYGYFNQMALDLALYNRAKESTHNFTVVEICDSSNPPKRALELKDISIQKHSILFRPVCEDEYVFNANYVEEGDVLLEIGINGYDIYFSDNNISKQDTLLWSGIRLYSSYSGYYSNKINDTILGSCNMGNTIKDGDLLFTIQLSKKNKEIDATAKTVIFTYDMLSRVFIESIPYLGDIQVYKWFVGNYTKVKEGDDILEITEFLGTKGISRYSKPKYSSIIKSPYSGLFVKRYNGFMNKLKKGDSLFSVYSDEAKIKDRYPNEIAVSTDDFTKSVTIEGCRCGGNKLGFRLHKIYVNFENIEGKNYLILTFDRKDMSLNKKCSMHLLLSDDSVITLNAEANPVKSSSSYSEMKFRLHPEDMIKLETEKFVKWRITNEEGVTLHSGNNCCCCVSDDASGFTKNLSYEVFQDFIREFNKAVRDNIPEEQREETKAENKEKASCYVYLMIDTTNNFHKIGISNNPRYREHTLQSDKPTIELICAKEYPSRAIAEAIESALHNVFANKRIRGEWFNLDASDVEKIKQTLI